MINVETVVDSQRPDHLVLLVGGNPLPLAVSGLVEAGPDTAISLIASQRSWEAAGRLETWLRANGRQASRWGHKVDPGDGAQIRGVVTACLEAQSSARCTVLNYTGGTNPMAVHAYQALRSWGTAVAGRTAAGTYLDAGARRLVADSPTWCVPEAMAAKIGLEDLLALHKWEWMKVRGHEVKPQTTVNMPDLAAALASALQSQRALRPWRLWQQCLPGKGQEHKVKVSLPSDASLTLVRQAMEGAWALPSGTAEVNLDEAAEAIDMTGGELRSWLRGKWLEHHTLKALKDLEGPLGLHDLGRAINPTPIGKSTALNFDLDVAGMRGHVLFGISCGTSCDKGVLKTKLFEAYHRTRQLGGDEAPVALVCTLPAFDDPTTPEDLQDELRSTLDPEEPDKVRVRVFGRHALTRLADELRLWITNQAGAL